MSNIPYTAPSRIASQHPVATPTAVAAYCSTHSTTEAAAYFGVSDRYIRKMKARAADTLTPTSTNQRPVEQPNVLIAPAPMPAPTAPVFATVAASIVADGDCMWKCSFCGDLHHPLPGTTGEQWRKDGCYLCSTRRATPIVMSIGVEPIGGTEQTIAELELAPQHEEMRPRLDVPAEPEPMPAAPMVGTGTAEQPPIVYRDRIVRERVIVRVPVERQSSGVVTWAQEHMPPVQFMVGLLITLMLIGIAALG